MGCNCGKKGATAVPSPSRSVAVYQVFSSDGTLDSEHSSLGVARQVATAVRGRVVPTSKPASA